MSLPFERYNGGFLCAVFSLRQSGSGSLPEPVIGKGIACLVRYGLMGGDGRKNAPPPQLLPGEDERYLIPSGKQVDGTLDSQFFTTIREFPLFPDSRRDNRSLGIEFTCDMKLKALL